MAALSGIALALGIGSLATQAWGGKKQADAAKEAGKAQRAVAESQGQLLDFNAHVADLQEKDAITRGAEAEQRFRATIRGTIGSQRAAFAANSVDVSFGSAVDVQADAAVLGELDALTIRTNAAREAWGYRVQAMDLRKKAEIARKEGANAVTAANIQAGAYNVQTWGNLLGGTSSLLQQRYSMGKK